MQKNWIRLPLEGADNTRELGGLPCPGGQTAWHRFLRSDELSGLTGHDINFLLKYGVTTVIDLRSPGEVERTPDHPNLLKAVNYHPIPFIQEDVSPEAQAEFMQNLSGLWDLYEFFIIQKDSVKQIFETIAKAPDGVVLFHCTAGKDRTGITALLLLMLAGVDLQDCQTNYMQTAVNLSRKEKFAKLMGTKAEYLLDSPPETIARAYEYVAALPGGVKGYLTSCGISDIQIKMVQERVTR